MTTYGRQAAPVREGRPVRQRASWKARALLVVLGLGLAVAALAAVEGILAALGAGDELLYDDPFVGFAPGSDLFAARTLPDGTRVYETRPEKLEFFNLQRFPVDKPPDGYRVFTLGGSTTAGRPYDARVAFGRWLELYLRAADPSHSWEVINAGAISYASYRVALLMKELVRYEPDLFVIYTGHNEFLEERTYSDIIHQPEAVKRVRMWLSGFRFAALARRSLHSLAGEDREDSGVRPRLAPEVEARLDTWGGLQRYRRDDELRRAIVEHFEYNLRRMVRIARDHGARVVFVQPVANLKDFSPFKSQHRAGLSAADRARFAELLAAGRRHLGRGESALAVKALRRAVDLDSRHAEAWYRLGRAHLAAGEGDAAHAAFVRAKEEDVAPLRALESMVAAVARLADDEGVPLVPLRDRLRAENERRFGIPSLGNAYLLDHVHPNIPVHSRIAGAVLALLITDGTVEPAPGWSEAARKRIFERELTALDREYYARRDLNLAKVLGWAGKLKEAETPLERAARVLTEEPEVWLSLGILYQRTGRYSQALEALDRARELAPGWELVHFNLGTTYGHLGRTEEGIAALRRALEIRPDYPEALENLATLRRRAGDLDAALAALGRAERTGGNAERLALSRGLVYRLQGRLAAAEAQFRRLVKADPQNVAARTELGITLGRRGRLGEAASELIRATENDPGHVEAWYNLGVVRAQQGNDEAAAIAYTRTLELAPRHPEAHNNLGIRLAQRGDLEAARRHFEAAAEADPTYAEAYLNLGVALDGIGRRARALAAVERAVELEPDNPRFHLALGRLYAAGGRTAEALHHLERARAGGQPVPDELLSELRRLAG